MDEIENDAPLARRSPTVGAVLVSHNGARWLPKVLSSFSNMFHAPTAWRVVDVSSTDGSAELVARLVRV
ncbi:glycosyltransferase family 2 protein [Aeromicrobium sp. UC242_57]|uniref:glycosyltransferase family 2 protein n=1 Tax=Aeromicrobium sp. UC242_57 TaxID=3374624 RepID=UPI00378CAC06